MIYFDSAATSYYRPDSVALAVADAVRHMGNSSRGMHDAALDASRTIFEVREKLGEMFGCGPSQIAFSSNVTESLNTAVCGLLSPGDHVVTTVLEHNSVLRPLYRMEQQGVELSIAECDAFGVIRPEHIKELFRPNTRAVVCTHASNLTGNLTDIRRIGKAAHERGILMIVDGAQTAGIFPVDLLKDHVDVFCFTGHKSLLGPQGTGGMAVRRGLAVNPLKVGGSGMRTFEKEQPGQMPEVLEAGTLNGHGIAGLGAGIDYINRQGMDHLREKELRLAGMFYEEVVRIPGVAVYGSFAKEQRAPIVSLNIRDIPSGEVSSCLMEEYGICTRSGGHCAPLMHKAFGTEEQGMVRFSFSSFNTEEQTEQAVKSVKEIAEES
ncbi:aminotransferase class V-fold PLP-dependent enzyme [Anaerostipes sp.]|uniref:aminotransferase class V-fold PLP-dependent enzyme n=1 Tax=Anaerostipes sp. TaxID=1872530 RepID=UPI0025B978F8|nr:aminotransferase class V-fold PLP-dependent enzyme [Anaerostipes sp.]MBS7009733.1 aminotransferase class V-fold PLP-dependent enzyme [Anaerostipes sp.]